MPLDESRRLDNDLILVEIASRYDVTRWRGFITPAWFFIAELCKCGFRIRYIQFRPFIEIRFEAASARRDKLCAIFAFALFEDCIRGTYPASLISKLVGEGIEQHNMSIAAAKRLHERGFGVRDDGDNGVTRPFGELGGDHFGGIDLRLRVGGRRQGKDQGIFRQTKLSRR